MADITRWEEFLEEGNELYNYMINNFNDMIDDKTIRHFEVEHGPYDMISHVADIKKKYFYDIQKELIPWIKKEASEGLFEYDNWMPFRDSDVLTIMFLGYRKMFYFKQYIFQLTMRLVCDTRTCEHCKLVDSISTIHFRVALYGWKDDNNKIQPEDLFIPLEGNIMPDSYWYYERKFCTGK